MPNGYLKPFKKFKRATEEGGSITKITVGQAIEDHLSFLGLIHSHPNALVYFWHHPRTGTWVGATPELL